MNLNQLEYFVSAAETLNFTRAAEKHFISQTAMTQQIRALEQTVGVPLFIRDKHHVELTTAGRIYLNEARTILERSEEALRLARLAAEGTQGELTLGYISGFGHADFAGPLRRFHQAYPGVSLKLIRNNSSVLMEHLERGECDAVLIVSLSGQEKSEQGRLYLKSYPVMAILPTGHPLTEQNSLTYSELKGEEFIMMEPSDRPMDQMEESLLIFKRGGFLPNVVAIEGEPETLLLMVSAGMGISILPEYIVRPYLRDRAFRALPLLTEEGNAETIDFEILWMKNNSNPVLENFLEHFADYEKS